MSATADIASEPSSSRRRSAETWPAHPAPDGEPSGSAHPRRRVMTSVNPQPCVPRPVWPPRSAQGARRSYTTPTQVRNRLSWPNAPSRGGVGSLSDHPSRHRPTREGSCDPPHARRSGVGTALASDPAPSPSGHGPKPSFWVVSGSPRKKIAQVSDHWPRARRISSASSRKTPCPPPRRVIRWTSRNRHGSPSATAAERPTRRRSARSLTSSPT